MKASSIGSSCGYTAGAVFLFGTPSWFDYKLATPSVNGKGREHILPPGNMHV